MKYTIDDIKEIVRLEIGHEVVSTEYINTKTIFDIKCICGVIYKKCLRSIREGSYHCNGKKQIAKKVATKEINCANLKCQKIFKPRLCRTIFCSLSCSKQTAKTDEYKQNMRKLKTVLKPIICQICKEEFQPSHSVTKLCSSNCRKIHEKTPEYREKAKENGIKAGRISAQSQGRRSKNEIYFAELCEEYFGKDDIICNQPIFDGWDADVIITSKKMAVLWNGQWHYKQIMKSQSLKQVQARDKIKWHVILKNGYTPFVIKDMGKHNPKFVEQEFAIFILSLIDL